MDQVIVVSQKKSKYFHSMRRTMLPKTAIALPEDVESKKQKISSYTKVVASCEATKRKNRIGK